jgi:transposase
MLSEATVNRVYLARGRHDLRKSIDGLAVLVKEEFDLNGLQVGKK